MMDLDKKVYISGVLTSVDTSGGLKSFYENIGSVCTQIGLKSYIPHLHTDPEKHASVDPEQVWKIDKEQVLSSFLVIAYVGEPSLGVGMEIAYAEQNNIPVILMYEANARVSRMARGLPRKTKIAEIAFNSYEEGLLQLHKVLHNWSISINIEKSDQGDVLFIEEIIESNGVTNQVVATRKDGSILLNLNVGKSEENWLIKSKLMTLRDDGVMPYKIYLGIWSHLQPIISDVWPQASILHDFQD